MAAGWVWRHEGFDARARASAVENRENGGKRLKTDRVTVKKRLETAMLRGRVRT